MSEEKKEEGTTKAERDRALAEEIVNTQTDKNRELVAELFKLFD